MRGDTAVAASGVSRCRVCGADDTVPWLVKQDLPIHRCRRCGNAFLPDTAVPVDLEALYEPGYFGGEGGTGYPTYEADGPLLERSFARRLAWIATLGTSRRLLDVGSAYGFLLKAARQAGWEAMGVEIAAECAAVGARRAGVPVVAGDFLRADLPGGFGVITMLDVLEHMRDPGACVERARDLLAPGGVLVVETGDLASPWARLLGRRWYFLDPPQHLSYFTATGLVAFLEQQGLVVQGGVRRFGRWVSLANIAFKLGARRLAGARPPGALYLNLGDAMLVAARRA